RRAASTGSLPPQPAHRSRRRRGVFSRLVRARAVVGLARRVALAMRADVDIRAGRSSVRGGDAVGAASAPASLGAAVIDLGAASDGAELAPIGRNAQVLRAFVAAQSPLGCRGRRKAENENGREKDSQNVLHRATSIALNGGDIYCTL